MFPRILASALCQPKEYAGKMFGDSLQGVPKPEVVVISAKERVNIGAIMPAV